MTRRGLLAAITDLSDDERDAVRGANAERRLGPAVAADQPEEAR
jgi:hypothetical protein